MSAHTTDLRWKDEQGIVHNLEQREKEVFSGRGTRMTTYWAALCGERAFTQGRPPALVDEATSCMECMGHVAQ